MLQLVINSSTLSQSLVKISGSLPIILSDNTPGLVASPLPAGSGLPPPPPPPPLWLLPGSSPPPPPPNPPSLCFPVSRLLGSGGSSPLPSPRLYWEGKMVWRIPSALVVFPLWDTPVPKVQATRLSERVFVDVICAIAPANDRGWTGGLLIWEGMSWARVAMSISSFWDLGMTMSGSGVSPPVSLPNLKLVSGVSSSSGVLSRGPQWLLSCVLSSSKMQSPYLMGAGLLITNLSFFMWVHPHCRRLKLKSTGIKTVGSSGLAI